MYLGLPPPNSNNETRLWICQLRFSKPMFMIFLSHKENSFTCVHYFILEFGVTPCTYPLSPMCPTWPNHLIYQGNNKPFLKLSLSDLKSSVKCHSNELSGTVAYKYIYCYVRVMCFHVQTINSRPAKILKKKPSLWEAWNGNLQSYHTIR